MRAIQLPKTTGVDAVVSRDVPRPEPDSDELLVDVRAAGVNPLDWLLCRGLLTELRADPLPWTLGWDLSGVVDSVGADVTRFEPGDAVCGMVRPPGAGGTFAEYATVTPAAVTAKPPSLSHIEAAGVPMAGQTAFHALYETAGLDADQRVLVHAAAGGVGHFAVQLATDTGAHVAGTASGRNEQFLRDLGVDAFVDYREDRFEDVLDGVDVVVDAVGGEVLERSVELTRAGGVVVTLPDQPSATALERFRTEHGVSVRHFDVLTESDPATLHAVASRVDAGALEPTVSDTYPLSDAPRALERSADGHVRGKLVLTGDPG